MKKEEIKTFQTILPNVSNQTSCYGNTAQEVVMRTNVDAAICALSVKKAVKQAAPRSSGATHNSIKKSFWKRCSGNTAAIDNSSGSFS